MYLSSKNMGVELKYINEAFKSNWKAPLEPLILSFLKKCYVNYSIKKATSVCIDSEYLTWKMYTVAL